MTNEQVVATLLSNIAEDSEISSEKKIRLYKIVEDLVKDAAHA